MNRSFALCGLISLTMGMAACGTSGDSSAPGGSPGTESADVQSAQAAHDSADHAGAADSSTAGGVSGTLPDVQKLFADVRGLTADTNVYAGTFNSQGCKATVTGMVTGGGLTGGVTLDANVAFNDGTCTGQRSVSGSETVKVTLSGDANRALEITEYLSVTMKNKDVVTINSNDLTLPTLTVQASGGVKTADASLTVTQNERRVRKSSSGSNIFDMSISTDTNAPLVLQSTYTGGVVTTETVVSGVSIVHHNLAKFIAKHTFDHVSRDSTCHCPSSGLITQNVSADDGSGTYTRTYTFTSCGTATVATTASTLKGTSNGSATVTWDSCD